MAKFTFSPNKKEAALEICMSSLEEKQIKIDVIKKNIKNITIKE